MILLWRIVMRKRNSKRIQAIYARILVFLLVFSFVFPNVLTISVYASSLTHTHTYEEGICTECGEVEPFPADGACATHTYTVTSNTATCTMGGEKTETCSGCGDTITTEVEALGHEYESVITPGATCADDSIETFTCIRCGDSFEETKESEGHQYAETSVTDATCTTDGEKELTCSACGDVITESIPKTGHDYETVVITPATTTSQGLAEKECQTCGEVLQITLPMVGNINVYAGHNNLAIHDGNMDYIYFTGECSKYEHSMRQEDITHYIEDEYGERQLKRAATISGSTDINLKGNQVTIFEPVLMQGVTNSSDEFYLLEDGKFVNLYDYEEDQGNFVDTIEGNAQIKTLGFGIYSGLTLGDDGTVYQTFVSTGSLKNIETGEHSNNSLYWTNQLECPEIITQIDTYPETEFIGDTEFATMRGIGKDGYAILTENGNIYTLDGTATYKMQQDASQHAREVNQQNAEYGNYSNYHSLMTKDIFVNNKESLVQINSSDIKFSKVTTTPGKKAILAISENGDIWGFGEPESQIYEEGQLTENVIFVEIAAGRNHVIALDNNGHIWAMGKNNTYQCGTGDTEQVIEFTQITDDSLFFVSIDAGDDFSAAVTNTGHLYTFGDNSLNQCGVSEPTIDVIKVPTLIADLSHQCVFTKSDYVVTKEATCGDTGTITRTCPTCGDTTDLTIHNLDHYYYKINGFTLKMMTTFNTLSACEVVKVERSPGTEYAYYEILSVEEGNYQFIDFYDSNNYYMYVLSDNANTVHQTITSNGSEYDITMTSICDTLSDDYLKQVGYVTKEEREQIKEFYEGVYFATFYINNNPEDSTYEFLTDNNLSLSTTENKTFFILLFEELTKGKDIKEAPDSYYNNAEFTAIAEVIGYNESDITFLRDYTSNREYFASDKYMLIHCEAADGEYLVLYPVGYGNFKIQYEYNSSVYTYSQASQNIEIVLPNSEVIHSPSYGYYIKVSDPSDCKIQGVNYYYKTDENFVAATTVQDIINQIYDEEKIVNSYYSNFTSFKELHPFNTRCSSSDFFLYQYSSSIRKNYGYKISTGNYTVLETPDNLLFLSDKLFTITFTNSSGLTNSLSAETLVSQMDFEYLASQGYSLDELNKIRMFFKDVYVYKFPGTNQGYTKLNLYNIQETTITDWTQVAINYYEQYKDSIISTDSVHACNNTYSETYQCYYCGEIYSDGAVEYNHVMPKYGNYSIKEGYAVFRCVECNEFLKEEEIHYRLTYTHDVHKVTDYPVDSGFYYDPYNLNNQMVFLSEENHSKLLSYTEEHVLPASINDGANFNVIISSPTEELKMDGTVTQTGFNDGYSVGDTVSKLSRNNNDWVNLEPIFTSDLYAPTQINIDGTPYTVTKWYAFEYRPEATSTYDYTTSNGITYTTFSAGQPILAGDNKTLVLIPSEGEGATKYIEYYDAHKETNLEIKSDSSTAKEYPWYITKSLSYGDYYSSSYGCKVNIYIQDSNGNYTTPISTLTDKTVYFIGEGYYNSYAHVYATPAELTGITNPDMYELDTTKTTSYANYSSYIGANIYLKPKMVTISVLDEENPYTVDIAVNSKFNLPLGIKNTAGDVVVGYYSAANGKGDKYDSFDIVEQDISVYPYYVSAVGTTTQEITMISDQDISEDTEFLAGSTVLIKESTITDETLTSIGVNKQDVNVSIYTDNPKLRDMFNKSAATARACNVMKEYNNFTFITDKRNGILYKTYVVDKTEQADAIKVGNNKVKTIDEQAYYINHNGSLLLGTLVYNYTKGKIQFLSNSKLYDCTMVYKEYCTYADIKVVDSGSETPQLSPYMLYSTTDELYKQVYIYTKDNTTHICDANGTDYNIADSTLLYTYGEIYKPTLNNVENQFIYIKSSVWGNTTNDVLFELDKESNLLHIYELASSTTETTVSDITNDNTLLEVAVNTGKVLYSNGNAFGEYLPEIYFVENYLNNQEVDSGFLNSYFKQFSLPCNEDCIKNNFVVEKYTVRNRRKDSIGNVSIELTPSVITLDTDSITAYEYRDTTLISESYESPSNSEWYMKYDSEIINNPYWVNAQYSKDEDAYYDQANVKTVNGMNEALIELNYNAFQTNSMEELQPARIYLKSKTDGRLVDITDSIGIKYEVLSDTTSSIFNGDSITKAYATTLDYVTSIIAISEEGGVWFGTSNTGMSQTANESLIASNAHATKQYYKNGTTTTGMQLRKYYSNIKFTDMTSCYGTVFLLDENGNIWIATQCVSDLNEAFPVNANVPFHQITNDIEFAKLGRFSGASMYAFESPLPKGQNSLFYAIDKEGYIWHYNAGSLSMEKDNAYSKETKFIDVAGDGYYPYAYAIDEDNNLWIKGQYSNAIGYYNNGIANTARHTNIKNGQLAEWTPLNELYTDYKDVKWKSIELGPTSLNSVNGTRQLGLIDTENQLWRLIKDGYNYDFQLGYVIAEKDVAKWNGVYTLGLDGNIYLSDSYRKGTLTAQNCIYDGGDVIDIADVGSAQTFTKANGEIVVLPIPYEASEDGERNPIKIPSTSILPKEVVYWQYDTDNHREIEYNNTNSSYLSWDFAQKNTDFLTLTPEHINMQSIKATISISDLETYDGITVADGDKIYIQTEVEDSLFYLTDVNEIIYTDDAVLLTEQNRPVTDVKSETDITVNNLDIERVTMDMDRATYYCRSNYSADTTNYYSEQGMLRVVPLVSIEATYTGPDITIGRDYDTDKVDLILHYEDGSDIEITWDELTTKPDTMVTQIGPNTYEVEYEGKTDTFEVNGRNGLLSLDLTYDESVFVGTEFEPEKVTVTAVYSDGTMVTPDIDWDAIDKTVTKVGDNVFEVEHDGVIAELVVQGYYYDELKATYNGSAIRIHDSFTKDDISVSVTYTENNVNKTEDVLTVDEWTIDSLDVFYVGNNDYVVTFVEDPTLKDEVTVIGLDYIYKIEAVYEGNDILVKEHYNKADVAVYGVYRSDDRKERLATEDWHANSLMVAEVGSNEYLATYEPSEDESFTANYYVNGIDYVYKIEAEYKGEDIPVHEQYNKEDVEVSLVYRSDDRKEPIEPDKWTESGLDVGKVGENEYTATYKPDDNTELTTTYTVTGFDYVYKIEATYKGKDILVNENYDKKDVEVYVVYRADNRKELIDQDKWDASSLKVTKKGENEYTATYQTESDSKLTATYAVKGYEKASEPPKEPETSQTPTEPPATPNTPETPAPEPTPTPEPAPAPEVVETPTQQTTPTVVYGGGMVKTGDDMPLVPIIIICIMSIIISSTCFILYRKRKNNNQKKAD